MICPGWDDQRYGLVRTSSQTLAVTPQKLHAVRACPCLEEAKEKLIRAATNHLTDATMCYAMKMLKEKVAGQKKAKKIRWGGRLRGKTEAAMIKYDHKQRSLQLEKNVRVQSRAVDGRCCAYCHRIGSQWNCICGVEEVLQKRTCHLTSYITLTFMWNIVYYLAYLKWLIRQPNAKIMHVDNIFITTRDCGHVETQMSLPLPMVGSWHRTYGLYTVFETVETPAGLARSNTALAKMDWYDLAHGYNYCLR